MNTHWSPDNMYSAFTEGITDIGTDEIYEMLPDGTSQVNLTKVTNLDVGADWSN